MGEPDLQEIHDFLVQIAHKAGAMITAARPSNSGSGSKKNCEVYRALMSPST